MRALVLKYFSLWRAFFRNSLALDMEFKEIVEPILEVFAGGIFGSN